jgi:hypothetical protein
MTSLGCERQSVTCIDIFSLSYLVPEYSPQLPVLKRPHSLNLRDQVSCSYKTAGKIVVL